MHFMDRSQAAEPPCLRNYDWRHQNWEDLAPEDKQSVRESLKKWQKCLCAYCESAINEGQGHIEHFRRKNPNHFPQLAFKWNNLFLSCSSNEHCGHFKDKRGSCYKADDLVKPDIDNPDDFFHFHASGEVRVRSGASEEQTGKAAETIRVFNLNEGSLQACRRRAIQFYMKRETDIIGTLNGFSEKDRSEFIEEEIRRTSSEEFCTTIRHFLQRAS